MSTPPGMIADASSLSAAAECVDVSAVAEIQPGSLGPPIHEDGVSSSDEGVPSAVAETTLPCTGTDALLVGADVIPYEIDALDIADLPSAVAENQPVYDVARIETEARAEQGVQTWDTNEMVIKYVQSLFEALDGSPVVAEVQIHLDKQGIPGIPFLQWKGPASSLYEVAEEHVDWSWRQMMSMLANRHEVVGDGLVALSIVPRLRKKDTAREMVANMYDQDAKPGWVIWEFRVRRGDGSRVYFYPKRGSRHASVEVERDDFVQSSGASVEVEGDDFVQSSGASSSAAAEFAPAHLGEQSSTAIVLHSSSAVAENPSPPSSDMLVRSFGSRAVTFQEHSEVYRPLVTGREDLPLIQVVQPPPPSYPPPPLADVPSTVVESVSAAASAVDSVGPSSVVTEFFDISDDFEKVESDEEDSSKAPDECIQLLGRLSQVEQQVNDYVRQWTASHPKGPPANLVRPDLSRSGPKSPPAAVAVQLCPPLKPPPMKPPPAQAVPVKAPLPVKPPPLNFPNPAAVAGKADSKPKPPAPPRPSSRITFKYLPPGSAPPPTGAAAQPIAGVARVKPPPPGIPWPANCQSFYPRRTSSSAVAESDVLVRFPADVCLVPPPSPQVSAAAENPQAPIHPSQSVSPWRAGTEHADNAPTLGPLVDGGASSVRYKAPPEGHSYSSAAAVSPSTAAAVVPGLAGCSLTAAAVTPPPPPPPLPTKGPPPGFEHHKYNPPFQPVRKQPPPPNAPPPAHVLAAAAAQRQIDIAAAAAARADGRPAPPMGPPPPTSAAAAASMIFNFTVETPPWVGLRGQTWLPPPMHVGRQHANFVLGGVGDPIVTPPVITPMPFIEEIEEGPVPKLPPKAPPVGVVLGSAAAVVQTPPTAAPAAAAAWMLEPIPPPPPKHPRPPSPPPRAKTVPVVTSRGVQHVVVPPPPIVVPEVPPVLPFAGVQEVAPSVVAENPLAPAVAGNPAAPAVDPLDEELDSLWHFHADLAADAANDASALAAVAASVPAAVAASAPAASAPAAAGSRSSRWNRMRPVREVRQHPNTGKYYIWEGTWISGANADTQVKLWLGPYDNYLSHWAVAPDIGFPNA